METRPKSPYQRRWSRHPYRIPCTFWIEGVRHRGTVRDISRAGIFVETEAKAAPGALATFLFRPEQAPDVRVSGHVVRTEQICPDFDGSGGLGVELLADGALGRLLDAYGVPAET